jgi:hypothetical protein
MFSFLSSYNQTRLQAKNHKAQERTLRNNAKGTRNRAKAQSSAIKKAAQDNQLIAAENLMTAQSNKRHAEAEARTAMGYSGFDTGEGTGSQALLNLQQQLDAEIANMEKAASISMLNAWQSSIDTERQGEIEARAQEAQAEQYSLAAKSARTAGTIGLIGGAINGLVGGYQAYKQNGDDFGAALMAGSQAAYSGFHFVNSFNPYTAAISADANNRKNNWGGLLSVLSGNVPYKVPAAGQIFSDY